MKISTYKYLISAVCLIFGLTSYATTYASLSPVPTEIIYALNAEKNLVGVSTTCNFPEETKEKPIHMLDFDVNESQVLGNVKYGYGNDGKTKTRLSFYNVISKTNARATISNKNKTDLF